MYKMMRHNFSKTFKQLEAFAMATWNNCLPPFRESLIAVERYLQLSLETRPAYQPNREWEHFNATNSCPYHYHLSCGELEKPNEEVDAFNTSQGVWSN